MSQSKPAAAEPSEIAGRYQVVKKLGAGAFGTVYKAKDKILGRMVAIKTIRLEGLAAAGASLEELMDRFKREAQVSAQLKHPNIVTIYDIGDSGGMSYLAMEFIDGVGLDRIIASEGRLPLERAAAIGAQVADALDFAHRNSVVHRDIKPANIMIEGGDRVKVTDFGIAKVTNSGEHLTMTGSLLGTPSYMSPEQAKGSELDGRSDLFAVGCVIYEMLAGKKAFRGDSITGLIFKIITEEPQPLREMDPTLSEEAVRIIAKALSKVPETRYQTGRELADDLLGLTRAGATPTLRQAETPTAKGVTPATMLIPSPGSPKDAPTVASAPTALGAAPTRVSAPPPKPAAKPAAPPPARPSPPPPRPAPLMAAPPPSSSKAGLLIGLAGIGLVGLVLVAGGGWFLYQKFAGNRTTAAEEISTRPADVRPADTTLPAPTLAADDASRRQPPETEATTVPARTEIPAPHVESPADTSREPARTGVDRTDVRSPDSRRVADATRGPVTPADRGRPPLERTEPRAESKSAPPNADFTFLDEEPAMDGAEAGERVADAYRSQQGRTSSGSFGSRRPLRARERSPRSLMPVEMPAVATLRHIMTFEEAFHRKEGRYGSLAEIQGHGMRLDVGVQGNTFQRRGYRFELRLTDDGFQATAMPLAPGPRPFHGDDSGFIQPGLE